MQLGIIDYLNGKFQGNINTSKQRHGLGIFINDDLTFYVSHWQQDKLNGPTLIYLTHGKYMYGEWKNNQPNGLNVLRSGDTVLLSKFQNGVPVGQGLLIFQREKFAFIITQKFFNWEIAESGTLTNHQTLLNFIQKMGMTVPDYYFSLTKYACVFSHGNRYVKIFPCMTNFCYFGFVDGLSIIFNSDNGVVSVGYHRNETLCEFGGKFDGIRSAEEGNFQPGGETVKYKKLRHVGKIHHIYQHLHKKAKHFVNDSVDPHTKVFYTVEEHLRTKLRTLGLEGKDKHIFKDNIEESLEYREYDENESLRVYENRQRLYSPPKKTNQRSNQIKKNVQIPIMCRNPRPKDSSSPLKIRNNSKYLQDSTSDLFSKETNEVEDLKGRISTKKTNDLYLRKDKLQMKLLSDFSKRVYIEKNSQQQNIKTVNYEKYGQLQKSPTFRTQNKQTQEQIQQQKNQIDIQSKQIGTSDNKHSVSIEKKRRGLSIQSIARPSYQQIEQRRKRVLIQFNYMKSQQTSQHKTFKSSSQQICQQKQNKRRESQENIFSCVPLSISNRQKQRYINVPRGKSGHSPLNHQPQERIVKTAVVPQQTDSVYSYKASKTSQMFKNIHLTSNNNIQQEDFQLTLKKSQDKPQHKIQIYHNDLTQTATKRDISPSRQKKTYVYLFDQQ